MCSSDMDSQVFRSISAGAIRANFEGFHHGGSLLSKLKGGRKRHYSLEEAFKLKKILFAERLDLEGT